MAQVMRFHERPTSYNWGAMPNRLTRAGEAPEIALLMLAAGNSVDMKWRCSSSGAKTYKVEKALENDFGYSNSTDYRSLNVSTAEQEIRSRRPVILKGRSPDTNGDGDKEGHAWVADGYKWYYTQCCGYLSFHMNWGWNDNNGSVNGWYSAKGWRPRGTSFDFKYDRAMVIVRP